MNIAATIFHSRHACPLCHSVQIGDFLRLDNIRIAKCATCDFMFARDILAPEAIDHFYVDGYHDQRHMNGQQVNAGISLELLRSLRIDLKGKSVLDVGSGYGFLLDKLRDNGARRTVGIELSRAQRSYATDKLRLEVLQQLDALSSTDRFDVITLFEVIEHIPAPYEFMQAICERLKPGGSLIVGTDNFTSDAVTVLGGGFPKWIPHEHVSFFTPDTLKAMLLRCDRLTFSAARSFTPWELLLRKLVFQATAGRKGAKTYSYQAESAADGDRGYRFFSLRLAANRSWFRLTNSSDPRGEMMYLHMVKA